MLSRGPSRGFTLVELLVVIGIIVVLIGLLLPALFHAEEKGRRTRCLSNARQIALAAVNLFEELGEELPRRDNPTHWGEAAQQLLPYARNIREIFDCPANPGTEGYANCKMPDHDFYTEYEMNGYLCSCPGLEYRRQSMITDYSCAAYVYDFPYEPANPDRPHENGVNCGYLDGHAAWLADEDMGTLGPGANEDTFFHKGHSLWQL